MSIEEQLNGSSWFPEMVSQTLGFIRQLHHQLLSMFHLRGLMCSAKDFYLRVVLLCAVFILVTCKQHAVKEGQSQLNFEACTLSGGNFGASSADVCDDHLMSESVPKDPIQLRSIENICPSPDLFCFPSTLTGLGEFDVVSEASDTSVGFSSGLKQTTSNLTLSRRNNNFRLLNGRHIFCSLYQLDDLDHILPSDGNTGNSQLTDVSSCISPLVHNKAHTLESRQPAMSVDSGFLESLSTPTVEIRPSLMDWGEKKLYNPSTARLTVKNIDSDNVLTVYDLYSSNSQFYPCNSSQMILAPGEVALICLVFFPTQLGVSSAQLILQTNFGGFLLQARGSAVESPYLIKPLGGLDVYSSGKWRKNLSLFNPYDDAFRVEEVSAWLSTSSGKTSLVSAAKCVAETMDVSSKYNVLSSEDWLNDGAVEVGAKISIRPHDSWVVGPQETVTIVELDVSYKFEGKFFGALCLKLSRSSNSEVDTVMVPLEAEVPPSSPSDADSISVSLETLVPCDIGGSLDVALLVRNDSPKITSFMEVRVVGDNTNTFQIKSLDGLLLYPRSVTQVAILNFAHAEAPEVNVNCELHIRINDTRNSQIAIPCKDALTVCSGSQVYSSVADTEGFGNVDYTRERQRSSRSNAPPDSGSKGTDTRKADEAVLRNWKSQAFSSPMSVLDANEILFPVVQVGNYTSRWLTVKNPSPEPLVMQLILNSGEIIDECRKPDVLLQPSSPTALVGNKSIAPTRYGFSIAKDAVSEAFLHPYGSATVGPILFQPSNRCEWRSSVLIRNNLSGVEWLSLRGSGGLLSVGLLEGSDLVQSLQFRLNLPTQINVSSPEILYSTGSRSPLCSEPLKKMVHVKNMGDLPVEIRRIAVSGAECGLDGFRVHNCKGFTLQPGESVRLLISYRSDFSIDTIQRDLELVLATGILVIPMKASLPIYMVNFCKRSELWVRFKKVTFVLILASAVLYFLFGLLLPRVTSFAAVDLKSRKLSFPAVLRSFDSRTMQFNLKTSGAQASKMNSFFRIGEEEVLLFEPAARSSHGELPDQVHVKRSEFQKQQKSPLLDSQAETTSMSSMAINSSPVEHSSLQEAPDSSSLSVKVGKEKARKRRNKRHSGAGGVLFEVSSSQSGNSTPSSPLSPASSTLRRPWSLSPGVEKSVDARNPFTQAPDQQCSKIGSSESSFKVNTLANDVTSRRENHNSGSTAHEKPNLTRKVAGRAVLLPSATFPTPGRVVPAWTCHSTILAAPSAIAPQARAPGSRLSNHKTAGLEKKMAVEEKFTYDIWGDHLFGQPSIHKSIGVPSNNSHSFFVRGPQCVGENSVPKSEKINDVADARNGVTGAAIKVNWWLYNYSEDDFAWTIAFASQQELAKTTSLA